MKGVVLAGGQGTRLKPLTDVVCKQLLPVYNKPMVFYPMSVLMLAGIKEICLITSESQVDSFKKLLGDGSQWGLQIEYRVQPEPKGIAQSLVIASDFIGDEDVCLILGDNILYRDGLGKTLNFVRDQVESREDSIVFSYQVRDPERYGVMELKESGKNSLWDVLSIEEKPKVPKSNFASIGLYFLKNEAVEIASNLAPSPRGEFEITDVTRELMDRNRLKSVLLGRGTAWLDAGTFESMLEASQFVHILENRQGQQIADLDEIARKMNWV